MLRKAPVFPNFQPFLPTDSDWYLQYYYDNKLNPYADIHPANLFVWFNMKGDLGYSKINDTLVLKYSDTLDEDRINIMPVKNRLDDSVIQSIMQYLTNKNLPCAISEVPDITCSSLNNQKWSIEDDLDNAEYIIDSSQHASLSGHDMSRQRRRVNFFESSHQNDNLAINFYPHITSYVKKLFLDHLKTMPLNSTELASQKNVFEAEAIRRNLEYADEFNKQALVIKINDRVASLVIFSQLDESTISVNHVKVDYSIQYIFQYTLYVIAKEMNNIGISQINLEQDLGLQGLRTFKQRLHPSKMLYKKTIKPL